MAAKAENAHSWFSAADPGSPELRNRGSGEVQPAARASPTETARPPSKAAVPSVATDAVCHRILDFVVSAEIGGRHNLVAWGRDSGPRGDEEQRKWALQLAVERCRPTDAAVRKATVHVCRYQRSGKSATLEQSWTMHSDATPESVHTRKRQRLCWDEVELVGGILNGNAPPDSRRNLLRAVRAATTGSAPPPVLHQRDSTATSEAVKLSSPSTADELAGASSALLSLLADSDDDGGG